MPNTRSFADAAPPICSAPARRASLPSDTSAFARWLALATVVMVLDQASKAWVLASFRPMEIYVVTPFFNLVLAVSYTHLDVYKRQAMCWPP